MASMATFAKLVKEYKSVAEFAMVYIEEAHASDGWEFPGNKYNIPQHNTLEDRFEAVNLLCKRVSDTDIGTTSCPILVDGMQNNANRTYGALPERLYVINRGVISYCSPKGPLGYVEGLAKIEQILKHSLASMKS